MENMNLRFHHKNKDFSNYDYRNILNFISSLYLELIEIEQNQSSHTKVGQVILEGKITELIQRIFNTCNTHYKNFKLRLEMEANN